MKASPFFLLLAGTWLLWCCALIGKDVHRAIGAQPAIADPKHAARLCGADNAALESFWSEDRRFFVAVCAKGVVALERVK